MATLQEKAEALDLMRTAYLLLLANHGHATTLASRQAIDATDLSFELNPLRSFEREFSGQVASRYTEAQLLLRRALARAGVAQPDDLGPALGVVSTAESYSDGIFDLIALNTHLENLAQNQRLARQVRELFEEIRAAEPRLMQAVQPLPTFDHDTGETGISAVADELGLTVGSARFWPWSRWVAIFVVPVVIAVAILAFVRHQLTSSPPYRYAIERARTSPRAHAALGDSVTTGWLVTGTIGSDTASMEIPVSGSRTSGDLHVVAAKNEGRWTVSTLLLIVDDGKPIDLRKSAD